MPFFLIALGVVALIAAMSSSKAGMSMSQLPSPQLPPPQPPPPMPDATTAEAAKTVDELLPVETKPAEVISPKTAPTPIAPTPTPVPVQETTTSQAAKTVDQLLDVKPEAVKTIQSSQLAQVLQPAGEGVLSALKTTASSLSPLVEAFAPTPTGKITTEEIKTFQRELNKFASSAKFAMLVVDGLLGKNTAGATVKTLNWILVRDPAKKARIDAWKASFVTTSGYNYNNLALAMRDITAFIRIYSASGVA